MRVVACYSQGMCLLKEKFFMKHIIKKFTVTRNT